MKVKLSKCAECPARFQGSTSTKMEEQQTEHWQTLGHRRYIGIRGWGSRTYSQYVRPQTNGAVVLQTMAPPTTVEVKPVTITTPVVPTKPGITPEQVRSIVNEAIAPLRSKLNELSEGLLGTDESVEEISATITGFNASLNKLSERLGGIHISFGKTSTPEPTLPTSSAVEGVAPVAPVRKKRTYTPEQLEKLRAQAAYIRTLAAAKRGAAKTAVEGAKTDASAIGPLHHKPAAWTAERRAKLSQVMKNLKQAQAPNAEMINRFESRLRAGVRGHVGLEQAAKDCGIAPNWAQKYIENGVASGKITIGNSAAQQNSKHPGGKPAKTYLLSA